MQVTADRASPATVGGRTSYDSRHVRPWSGGRVCRSAGTARARARVLWCCDGAVSLVRLRQRRGHEALRRLRHASGHRRRSDAAAARTPRERKVVTVLFCDWWASRPRPTAPTSRRPLRAGAPAGRPGVGPRRVAGGPRATTGGAGAALSRYQPGPVERPRRRVRPYRRRSSSPAWTYACPIEAAQALLGSQAAAWRWAGRRASPWRLHENCCRS
jgi:hypothetical protein